MTTQGELWRDRREEGIARASRGASAAWKVEAHRALVAVANRTRTFTSSDVYDAMDPLIRDTAKGQAMAGILRGGQSEGLCRPINEWRNEKRVRNHGRPQRVWESWRAGG